MEQIHLVQSKRTKSLDTIIPAKITEEYESIGFTSKLTRQTKALTLNVIDTRVVKYKGNNMIPTGQSFEASSQQVSQS
jgi:hypothetical protein